MDHTWEVPYVPKEPRPPCPTCGGRGWVPLKITYNEPLYVMYGCRDIEVCAPCPEGCWKEAKRDES